MPTITLPVFGQTELSRAKQHLASQVAVMMGRKLEEGDWSAVYCKAKDIPVSGWSNLNIDISYRGLGVEQKLLRISQLGDRPIQSVCGTTLMHPAATRSIRIDDLSADPNVVMVDVLNQYAELVDSRTKKVELTSATGTADMRIGWLLWEDSLTEFLYFEERMSKPNPADFFATWNVTKAKGTRKSSKSLWIYEKGTDKKRFSVTTSAGIKIQPYFDVPSPKDPNLYYFRVQGEPINEHTVQMWITSGTAMLLKGKLGGLDETTVTRAIQKALTARPSLVQEAGPEDVLAVPVLVNRSVYEQLVMAWSAVSDEHRAQLLVQYLSDGAPYSHSVI
jgi:hypothetical protein